MSILTRLFSSARDPREALRPLWQAIVAEARRPAWYADAGVADTVNGRFEMVSAVFALVVLRMETGEGLAKETALLTELYVEDMEAQLREFGIGDVVVGKRMTKLMGATGGRIEAYRSGIANGLPTMIEAAARNMPFVDGASAEQVAERLLALWSRLQSTPDKSLLAGEMAR